MVNGRNHNVASKMMEKEGQLPHPESEYNIWSKTKHKQKTFLWKRQRREYRKRNKTYLR